MKKISLAKSKTDMIDFTDRPLPKFARLYKTLEVAEADLERFTKIREEYEAMQAELAELMAD